jgi:hypothetical protein
MNIADSNRPRFRVIEGGGHGRPSWSSLPRTILGPSPFQADVPVTYRLALNDINSALAQGRKQPIFEVWSNVIGQLPPVPNISKLAIESGDRKLIGIKNAHACFRGLMRPIGEDARGFDHFAFVCKPRWLVAYEPSMSCVAKFQQVPDDVLFAIYAKMDYPLDVPNLRSSGRTPTSGVITHWQFVEADPLRSDFPVSFDRRYRKLQWAKPT